VTLRARRFTSRSSFEATPTGFEGRLESARQSVTDEEQRVEQGRDVGPAGRNEAAAVLAQYGAQVAASLRRIQVAVQAGDAGTALAEVATVLLLLDPDDEARRSTRKRG
jgi:hypothetical protein